MLVDRIERAIGFYRRWAPWILQPRIDRLMNHNAELAQRNTRARSCAAEFASHALFVVPTVKDASHLVTPIPQGPDPDWTEASDYPAYVRQFNMEQFDDVWSRYAETK